jgi:hypothetical protein
MTTILSGLQISLEIDSQLNLYATDTEVINIGLRNHRTNPTIVLSVSGNGF